MNRTWILRAVTAALVIASSAFVVGGAKWFLLSRARRASLATWTLRRAYGDRATLASTRDAADRHLTAANAALARADDAGAATELSLALEAARRAERSGEVFGGDVAANTVRRVLDVVDARPSVAYRPALRAAIMRTTLRAAARPFESWRLREAVHTLDESRAMSTPTWGVADALASDRVERVDPALAEMTRAAVRHDVAACEAIAAREGLRGAEGECARAVEIEKIDARLRGAKVRWGNVQPNGVVLLRPTLGRL